MTVSVKTYEQVALEDSDEQWELICGRLRAKPPMTAMHNQTARLLVLRLTMQLEAHAPGQYTVGERAAVRIPNGSYYVPDVTVVPLEAVRRRERDNPAGLEIYEEPLPLVVEVWSPSTGDYDVEEKLRRYQERGDAEIWRVHPSERTVTAWRRQPDGRYTET